MKMHSPIETAAVVAAAAGTTAVAPSVVSVVSGTVDSVGAEKEPHLS